MTTDERLAALEAKLDALTAPPSDYYTSRYSGEEIDAAIAAVPGKAETAQLCNRNLLDNWYFGNPVDQRGGYIVPAGVEYYKVDGFVPQGPIPETVRVDHIDYAGSAIFNYGGVLCYVPKDGGYVRGYVGAGYTVDRWSIFNNVKANLQNASLNIVYTASGWNLYTLLDNVLTPGTTYTLSCLYKASGNPIRLACVWGTYKFFFNEQAPISDNWTLAEITGTIPADATIDINQIVVQSLGSGTGNFSLKAIKLELGSQQTLAHQDADGNWVLNEVPDYGEQLRRCQRYQTEISAGREGFIGVGTATSTTDCKILVPLPTTMRTAPTLAYTGEFTLYSAGGVTAIAVTTLYVAAFANNALGVGVTVAGDLVAGQTYKLYSSAAASLLVNANL